MEICFCRWERSKLMKSQTPLNQNGRAWAVCPPQAAHPWPGFQRRFWLAFSQLLTQTHQPGRCLACLLRLYHNLCWANRRGKCWYHEFLYLWKIDYGLSFPYGMGECDAVFVPVMSFIVCEDMHRLCKCPVWASVSSFHIGPVWARWSPKALSSFHILKCSCFCAKEANASISLVN